MGGGWIVALKVSRCQLTLEDDAFPAISGIAQAFKNILQDRYVAGIWRDDMIHGLLWYPDHSSPDSIHPEKYRGKPRDVTETAEIHFNHALHHLCRGSL
jgi:hypothetical protein